MTSRASSLFADLSPAPLFEAMGWTGERELTAEESASTLFRFFRSKHVGDLKVILAAALVVAISCVTVLMLQAFAWLVGADRIADALKSLATVYVVPLFAFCCVLIGWAYRSASARLGVVDLFACEIATLCRVGTVFDIGAHYIELYEQETHPSAIKPRSTSRVPTEPTNFVSQEQYFPVFDSNSRDLQLLEARVVSNIVEFYTYMKAMRDSLRKLAAIDAALRAETVDAVPDPSRESPRQMTISNVIYMAFLAYESGRKAIRDLVEFEPFEAENTMVILITELKCFTFLVQCFEPQSLRRQRLELRRETYRSEVPQRCNDALDHHEGDQDWLPAKRTAPELWRRYLEAISTPSCEVAERDVRAAASAARVDSSHVTKPVEAVTK